jgi:signal transduction histidine kinase
LHPDDPAAAGLELRINDNPSLDSQVRTDVAIVEQILFNLVDNACKYAAPASREPRIDLAVTGAGSRHVALRIRDHGPGIPPAEARRLFQPFSRSAQDAAGAKDQVAPREEGHGGSFVR